MISDERIIRENPSISEQELDIKLFEFQKMQQERNSPVAQEVLKPVQSSYERRTPYKPTESAKGVIFGSEGVNNDYAPKRTGSIV